MKRLAALAAAALLTLGACGDDSEADDTVEKEDSTDETTPTEDEDGVRGTAPGDLPPAQGERQFVDEDGTTRTIQCAGGSVLIQGNENELTLTGQCADVYVTGDGNHLDVDQAEVLDVRGGANDLEVEGAGTIQLVGDENGVSVGQATTITVPGDSNAIAAGEVESVILLGNDVSTTAERAGTIITLGIENDVTWGSGTFGSEPRIFDYGQGNVVKASTI